MGFLRRSITLALFTTFCMLMASIPWEVADVLTTTHITRVFLSQRSKRRITSIFNNNKPSSEPYPSDAVHDLTYNLYATLNKSLNADDYETKLTPSLDSSNLTLHKPNADSSDYSKPNADQLNTRLDLNNAKDENLVQHPSSNDQSNIYELGDWKRNKCEYSLNSEIVNWILSFIFGVYIACVSYGEFVISLTNHLTKLSKRTEFLFQILYKITVIIYYIIRSKIKYIISWYSGMKHSNKMIVSTIFYTFCMAASLRASFVLISTNYYMIFKCTTFVSILFCQALIILHLKAFISLILFFTQNVFCLLWSLVIIIKVLKNIRIQIKDASNDGVRADKKDKLASSPKGKITTKVNEKFLFPRANWDAITRELSCLLEVWLVITCIDMIPLINSLGFFNFFLSHVVLFSTIESLLHVYIANIIRDKWINLSLGAFRHLVIKFFDFTICLISGWHDIIGSRCRSKGPKSSVIVMDRWRNSIIGYIIFAAQTCMSSTTFDMVKKSNAWIIVNFIIFHAPQVIFLILPKFIFNVYVYYMTILKPIIYTTITLETDPLGDFTTKIECLVLIVLAFITRFIISNNYFMTSNIIPCLALMISNKLISTMLLSLFKLPEKH